jgi:DNA excision repair protein ERCC-2
VAFDARVDTRFQQRARHHPTTAATLAALRAAAGGAVAVFLPSYAYAEAIQREAAAAAPHLRVALQPRARDLAAQNAWVEDSLRGADALLLVLGSSFTEGIDSLGGRVTHAMAVGPALPEVNAVQEARLSEAVSAGLTREEAFRRVYQIPGMTKVNQALGRLVRAPGQRARVLLHCRRFLEADYRDLLAAEYRTGRTIPDDATLAAWLSPSGSA